jgi:phage antirepressor YoqD-like protein
MSQLSVVDKKITMSSREIAELTGKEIGSVHRDIKTQLIVGLYGLDISQDANLHRIDIKGIFVNHRKNYQISEIFLNRYHADILVSGYEVKYRAAIVKRWHELEEKQTPGLPNLNPANLSRLQLLQMAMEAEQERLALEHRVEVLEPKANALDRIADADGAINITNSAKTLQVQPKKLFDYLREKRWIYRRPGGKDNVAYQDKIQAGYLRHKITTIHRDDGTEKIVEQVLVTPKGLMKLSRAFAGA